MRPLRAESQERAGVATRRGYGRSRSPGALLVGRIDRDRRRRRLCLAGAACANSSNPLAVRLDDRAVPRHAGLPRCRWLGSVEADTILLRRGRPNRST